MTDRPDDDDPNSEQFLALLREIRNDAEAVQRQHAETGQRLGYVVQATDQFSKDYEALTALPRDKDVLDAIKSGFTIGEQLKTRLGLIRHEVNLTSEVMAGSLPFFATAAAAGNTMSNSFAIPSGSYSVGPYPLDVESATDVYASKLALFDQTLGSVYRDAWAALHTHPNDPGRTALWQMRQAFDHLFSLLAPDGEVRGSKHWTRKNGPKPLQVHREERIRFSAHRWVAESSLRTVLLESAQETVRAYNRLQTAHDHHALDFIKAKETFTAVDQVIRRWVDSINPWPPSRGA